MPSLFFLHILSHILSSTSFCHDVLTKSNVVSWENNPFTDEVSWENASPFMADVRQPRFMTRYGISVKFKHIPFTSHIFHDIPILPIILSYIPSSIPMNWENGSSRKHFQSWDMMAHSDHLIGIGWTLLRDRIVRCIHLFPKKHIQKC